MRRFRLRPRMILVVVCAFRVALTQSAVSTETAPRFAIQTLAESKIDRLPAGPLYWRVETCATLSAAEGATRTTTLVAEVEES
jgi:hypothetical protein